MPASVTKISLSLDTEALAWARRTAKQTGRSLSAVLSDAARSASESAATAARRERAWSAFLDWFHEREAPLTPDELAAVDAELWGPPGAGIHETPRPRARKARVR